MKKADRKLSEVSPAKSVVEELVLLKTAAREATASFLNRVEAGIEDIRARAEACVGKESRSRDLRDMLMLLRGLDLKPAAGRRKDFKKLESAVEELRLLCHKW